MSFVPRTSFSSPVLPFTGKGKLLVGLLRALYSLVALWKGRKWRRPMPGFEENPLYADTEGVLYLGYKYYYRPPLEAEPGIAAHFASQHLDFSPPAGFVKESQLTVSAGGDLMPYKWINSAATQHLWDETGEFFFSSDLVFANLETPIDPSRPPSLVPEVMLNDMLFNGSEEMFRIFSGNGRFKGYDVVSTANNHSLDMGEQGIVRTMDFLESQDVRFVGTARSAHERDQFPIIEKKGIRTAFLAYTYSLNKLLPPVGKEWLVNHLRLNKAGTDIQPLVSDVALARQRGADVVILSLHTGCAYQPYPSAHTVAMYHRIFEESGVDIILGGHPHNSQPMEKYAFKDPFSGEHKQGFAVYSLADFVAYDIFVWDRMPLMLKLTIEKGQLNGKAHTQLTYVEPLPVYNWGMKDIKQGPQMRFLDLKKTVRQVRNQQVPPFMSEKCVRELMELNRFCDAYILPLNVLKTQP